MELIAYILNQQNNTTSKNTANEILYLYNLVNTISNHVYTYITCNDCRWVWLV